MRQLAEYLDHSGLDLEDIYESNHSWSELREAAGLPCRKRQVPRTIDSAGLAVECFT